MDAAHAGLVVQPAQDGTVDVLVSTHHHRLCDGFGCVTGYPHDGVQHLHQAQKQQHLTGGLPLAGSTSGVLISESTLCSS